MEIIQIVVDLLFSLKLMPHFVVGISSMIFVRKEKKLSYGYLSRIFVDI